MIVYRVNDSGRAYAFGLGIQATTWKEVNKLRRQIQEEADSKGNLFPVVYTDDGQFVVAGWEKGKA
jgi:hypothetical protein